jgi:hypothetical protein
MVYWTSLRPTKKFSKEELLPLAYELQKFNMEVASESYKEWYAKEHNLPLGKLDSSDILFTYTLIDTLPENFSAYYLDHILTIDVDYSKLEKVTLYANKSRVRKRLAKERLAELQKRNPIFNDFEVELNYEY